MAACLGALMTSTVRYYSFKDIPWTRKQPSLAIVLLCMTVALVWLYSEYVLILLACTYAAVGVVLHVVRLLRHRTVSRTGVIGSPNVVRMEAKPIGCFATLGMTSLGYLA